MNLHDTLTEFEVSPKKPKRFYLVLGALLLVTCFAVVPAFFYLKNLSNGNTELTATPIIILFVVTFYPIIGCYGFNHLKRYGWIICAHYTLSLTFVFLGIIFFGQNFNNLNSREVFKIICELLIGGASTFSIINLFRKKYLEAFSIDRSYIFLTFMLTILFPLFWFGILLSFGK